MKVVRQNFRFDIENVPQMLDRVSEEFIAFPIFEISNVLAHKCVLAFGKANSVLQFTADREHRRLLIFQKYRDRDEAPRSS